MHDCEFYNTGKVAIFDWSFEHFQFLYNWPNMKFDKKKSMRKLFYKLPTLLIYVPNNQKNAISVWAYLPKCGL